MIRRDLNADASISMLTFIVSTLNLWFRKPAHFHCATDHFPVFAKASTDKVGPKGIEPYSPWLKARYSTIELRAIVVTTGDD